MKKRKSSQLSLTIHCKNNAWSNSSVVCPKKYKLQLHFLNLGKDPRCGCQALSGVLPTSCRALARPLSPQYSLFVIPLNTAVFKMADETDFKLYVCLWAYLSIFWWLNIVWFYLSILWCVQIVVSLRSREMSVPFTMESEAQIACNSLSVDQEPKRGGAKKMLTVKGNVLHVWVLLKFHLISLWTKPRLSFQVGKISV